MIERPRALLASPATLTKTPSGPRVQVLSWPFVALKHPSLNPPCLEGENLGVWWRRAHPYDRNISAEASKAVAVGLGRLSLNCPSRRYVLVRYPPSCGRSALGAVLHLYPTFLSAPAELFACARGFAGPDNAFRGFAPTPQRCCPVRTPDGTVHPVASQSPLGCPSRCF